eukprot:gene23416-biopygen11835
MFCCPLLPTNYHFDTTAPHNRNPVGTQNAKRRRRRRKKETPAPKAPGRMKFGPPKTRKFREITTLALGVARKILQPCVPDASLTRSGRVPDASHATGRYCKLCGKCGKRAAQSAGCGVRGNTSQNLKKRMRPGRVPGVSSAVSPKQGQLPRDRPAFAAAWDKQAPARRVRARPGAVRSARASRPDLLFLP